MITPPVLDTDRLTMRAHVRDDFPHLHAMWGDPVVMRHIGGRPFTEEECWTRLLRYVGHWQVLGFGYWACIERTTGRYVGDVGFFDLHRDLAPPLGHDPEAGWVLASWAHGQGFATEALRAALAWIGARRTVCIIDPGNDASVKVAHKCGYRETGSAIYKGAPVRTFERPA